MRYFFCVIIISYICAGSADAAVIYPYLQDVTQNSVKVMWKTDSSSTGSVEYGLTDSYGSSETETTPTTFHTVTVSGLQSGTVYHYKVTCDSDASTDNTFSTAPYSNGSFTFIAYGDSRGNSSAPDFNYDHEAVINAITSHDPGTFIANTGDITYSGLENQWQPQFFQPAKNILKNNVLYPSIGNHDNSSTARGFFENYFAVPEESGSNFYYSFNYGNTHFVVLDTSQTYTNPSTQYTWLSNDLDSLNATSASWIVVLGHHPAYSSGSHGGTSAIQTDLVPLFEDKGVDIYIAGHDHIYERSYKDGIYYLVTGGGGASLGSVNQSSNPYKIYNESVYHHCLINMGQNGITITAYNNSNAIIDTCTILKRTWYLAEGCTNGFDEWILVQNPNSSTANIKLTFMRSKDENGNPRDPIIIEDTVTANSRTTYNVNQYVPNEAVSTKVESTNSLGIVAERAMYWDAGGIHWAGGHSSMGIAVSENR